MPEHDQKQKNQVERQARRMKQAEHDRPTLMAQNTYIGTLVLIFVLPVVVGAYLGRWLGDLLAGFSLRGKAHRATRAQRDPPARALGHQHRQLVSSLAGNSYFQARRAQHLPQTHRGGAEGPCGQPSLSAEADPDGTCRRDSASLRRPAVQPGNAQ